MRNQYHVTMSKDQVTVTKLGKRASTLNGMRDMVDRSSRLSQIAVDDERRHLNPFMSVFLYVGVKRAPGSIDVFRNFKRK